MKSTTDKKFNELKGLGNHGMQHLLRQIDIEIIATSLMKAEKGVKNKIFLNLSPRVTTKLKNLIRTAENDSNVSDIKNARKKILNKYKSFIKKGYLLEDLGNENQELKKYESIQILKNKKASEFTIEDLKTYFYEIAKKARNCGLLALESDIELIDDRLLQTGLMKVVDGEEPVILKKALKAIADKKVKEYKIRYESAIKAILSISRQ